MNDIYRMAIAHYGKLNQLDVAIEEMAELTKEIVKNKRGENNRDHIVEEIADVYVMLKQLELIFDIDLKEIIDMRNAKLKRLERRIQEDFERR